MKLSRLLPASILATLLILAAPHAAALSSTLDTDGDGIVDALEDANGNDTLDAGETDPFNADTDGGGESDGSETNAKRNPFDGTDDFTFDADGDGLVNGQEISKGTDPKNIDSDSDEMNDKADAFPLDSRYQLDANANNLPDEWEKATTLDQSQVTQMTVDDPDDDGLTNAEEFARGTDPLQIDTDRDGIDDKTEQEAGTDPRENACLSFGPVTDMFSDMGAHWSEKIVSRLRRTLILPDDTPLIRGYEDGGFHPDQSVTRYEFLKMVMLSTCSDLRNDTLNKKITFSDVPADAPVYENVDTAFRRTVIYSAVHYNIVTGYEDGTFRPDEQVNRAEALKILSLATRLQISESGSVLTFADVSSNDWFATFVQAAASREIVSGYGDGTFGPGNPITRAEAAKIIYLTMIQNPVINGYVLPTEE